MSTIYKDKNITKMYYGSTPVYSFSVEDGGGTGCDTTTYSYKTPTADVEGLKVLGWDDESIGYFKDNNLCYEWQKDDFKVSEKNYEIVSLLDNVNEIYAQRNNNGLVFLPKKEYGDTSTSYGFCEGCKNLIGLPIVNIFGRTKNCFNGCVKLKTIPPLDTANAVNMTHMFSNCKVLETIPPLNTSNVTNMDNMFSSCSSLQSIPLLDTSNVKVMNNMFYNCNSLQTIPLLDTSMVTDMNYMFKNCNSLQSIPLLNTSNVTNMSQMFYGCSSLQTIPLLDTSKATNMISMLYDCTSLQSIPLLDCGNITSMNYFFGYSNINTLTDLGGFKDLKISVTSNFLDKAPNLTVDSLMNVINYLYDLTSNGLSGQSLKFGQTNLDKLTPEQVAVATAKGWTLTT